MIDTNTACFPEERPIPDGGFVHAKDASSDKDAHFDTNARHGIESQPQDGALNVLVIEDDDVDFMQVSRNLRQSKRQLVLSHATSVGAGLAEISAREFDVILTDLHLPDSTGLETVKRLKEACSDVPLIVLTGLDDESVEQEILQAGAQDYLPKALTNSNWTRKAIEHAVQRQQLVNQTQQVTIRLQESERLLREEASIREETNQKLERICQTAHEFLAKASHDIRNPLTVIQEHISLVRDGLAGRINSKQVYMLEKAIVRADDVNAKLDDLVASSKLDAGFLEICRRPCDVNGILGQVKQALAPRATMRGVTLDVQVAQDIPQAFCDEQKACRILTSLGVNAIDACRDSGRVRLWVCYDDEHNQIRMGVSDNGSGIDSNSLAKLVERFQRRGVVSEPDDKFFGLGLSIASRFCRLNLGELNVESEHGAGSVFWFDLPAMGSDDIFPRWLTLQLAPMRHVQLIEFKLHESHTATQIRDMELLLTYLTENNELLLQISPSRWWLATSSLSSDPNVRVKKAADDLSMLTEVGAANEVSGIQMDTRAFWDAETADSSIVEQFRAIAAELS